MQNNRYLSFNMLIICIFIGAWILQSALFLNWDVNQLFSVTRLMLAGGRYGIDYLTPNPPLILYLSILPLKMSQYLSISIVFSFRFYMFMLSAISLSFCYYFIRLIFLREDIQFARIFFCGICFIFFVVPTFDFGQRDHLLVIFTLPYFLLIASRLQGHTPNRAIALSVGILASAGFALKPHFMLVWLMLEAYYVYSQKKIVSCLRVESIALLTSVAIYSITTLLFFPEFFKLVIPFISKYYIPDLSVPWVDLVLDRFVFYSLMVLLFYLFTLKNEAYSVLTSVLCVGLIGYLSVYFLQYTTFSYHKIPPFSFAILLALAWSCIMFKKYKGRFIVAMSIFMLSIPILLVYFMYCYGLYYKKVTLSELAIYANSLAIPHEKLYVFSQSGKIGEPLVAYAHMTNVQSIDALWVAIDLAKKIKLYGDKAARDYIKNNKDPLFFLNLIANDFDKRPPDLVFIDNSQYNFTFNGHLVHFNYLDYFLENNKFKASWKNYMYLTTLKAPRGDMSLNIYARRPITC